MKLTYVAIAGVAAIIFAMVILNLQKPAVEVVEEANVLQEQQKPEVAPMKEQETTEKLTPRELQEVDTDDVTAESEYIPPDLNAALESMQRSLAEGDDRTPPMAKSTPREKPTEEQLANPQLYEQYEAQQSAKIASIYLSAIKEIPIIRDVINSAKLSGSRTPEEIAEAEEALQKLEGLKVEFEQMHPELVEQMESDVSTFGNEATNVTEQSN